MTGMDTAEYLELLWGFFPMEISDLIHISVPAPIRSVTQPVFKTEAP